MFPPCSGSELSDYYCSGYSCGAGTCQCDFSVRRMVAVVNPLHAQLGLLCLYDYDPMVTFLLVIKVPVWKCFRQ